MLSPFSQSILAPVLVLLLALGNIPAWWHCGDCHPEREAAAAATGRCGPHACCCRADTAKATPAQLALENHRDGDSSHDPATCVACRAAIAGTTTTLDVAQTLPALTALSFTGPLPAPLLSATEVASARPRGPPLPAV